MRRPRRPAVPVLPLALGLTLLAACTDSLEAPTAGTARLHRATTASLQMRDAGIDLGDSHFSAVVETTTEYADADIAGTPLPSTDTEVVYVEGGYASDGSVRFGTWFEDAQKSPTLGSARLEYGRVNLYDRRGDLQASELFETFFALLGLPSASVEDAYFPFAPLPRPTCLPGDASCIPTAELQDGPDGATVTDVGGIREVRWGAIASTAAVGGAASGIGGAAGTTETVQRFRRVQSAFGAAPDWQLVESSSIAADTRGKGMRKQVSRITYRAFHRNPDREAARELKRKEKREAAPTGPGVVSAGVTTGAAAAGEASRPQVGTRAADRVSSVLHRPGADPEGILLGCPRGSGDFDRARNVQNGIQVVFQHGLCSDASVFSEFDLQLAKSYPISRSRAFSLESTASVDNQVTDLRQKLQSKVTVPQVLIGHSQGGLVARRLGQRHPELVSSVLTIGTPHLGAYLADLPSELVEDLMFEAMAPGCFIDSVCNMIGDWAFEVLVGEVTLGLDRSFPALGNLRTGSPFLQQLNATPEPFQRASIETAPPSRWNLARMIGDDHSPASRLQTGRRPGGDAAVTEVAKIYGGLQMAQTISQFLLFTIHQQTSTPQCQRADYSGYWPGCSYATSVVQWYSSQYQAYLLYLIYDLSGRIMSLMNRVDGTWNALVARRGEASDGLVHQPSQRYPSAPGSYTPRRWTVPTALADAHSGQTKSPAVLTSTREALTNFSKGSTP